MLIIACHLPAIRDNRLSDPRFRLFQSLGWKIVSIRRSSPKSVNHQNRLLENYCCSDPIYRRISFSLLLYYRAKFIVLERAALRPFGREKGLSFSNSPSNSPRICRVVAGTAGKEQPRPRDHRLPVRGASDPQRGGGRGGRSRRPSRLPLHPVGVPRVQRPLRARQVAVSLDSGPRLLHPGHPRQGDGDILAGSVSFVGIVPRRVES